MENDKQQPVFSVALTITAILNEQCATKEEALLTLEKAKAILDLGFDSREIFD
jgi:hypothetical protein